MSARQPNGPRFPRLAGKTRAVVVLWRLFYHLRNWREVWSAYRAAKSLPPLRFRRGFDLHHAQGDDPILLLHTVFARPEYAALGRRRPLFMLDIGANIGAVTLDRVSRDGETQIDAYEPDPATFATLRTNIRSNGLESRVRIYQEAVTGNDGSVLLWKSSSSVLSSTVGGPALDGQAISVPTISLDKAVARVGRSGLAVKIDAEGAEVAMLENASESTLAAIEEVALEYHDAIVPRARARCHAVLTKAGFTCECAPFSDDQGILMAWRAQAHAS